MRFYKGGHEALWKASKEMSYAPYKQNLYLVAEVDNNNDVNAVMLHNGKQKIASVSATDAPAIKRILAERLDGSKGDDVIVCTIDRIYESLDDFTYRGSITIRGIYRVNERFARKYAEHLRGG